MHVFSSPICVTGLAYLGGEEKDNLGEAFVRVDSRRQWRRVGNLQGHMPFPLRLKWSHIHDDATAGVGGLAQADRQHIGRNTEILHRARQSEGIGRNDAVIVFDANEAGGVEVLRVHHVAGVHIGENLELAGAAHIVAIAGGTVGDDLAAFDLTDLVGFERVQHPVLLRHAAYPFV